MKNRNFSPEPRVCPKCGHGDFVMYDKVAGRWRCNVFSCDWISEPCDENDLRQLVKKTDFERGMLDPSSTC